MIFHQHIQTNIGEVWVANATTNNCIKSDHESRQEYEARFVQTMLQEISENSKLDHESDGAPFLKGHPDKYISISHSEHWFAVYLSSLKPIGIDIEVVSNQLEKTKKYFLTEEEIAQLAPTNRELAICWGIKESVFKLLRGNITSMKEDILVTSISGNQIEAIAQHEKIYLHYIQTEAFTLVYTH